MSGLGSLGLIKGLEVSVSGLRLSLHEVSIQRTDSKADTAPSLTVRTVVTL